MCWIDIPDQGPIYVKKNAHWKYDIVIAKCWINLKRCKNLSWNSNFYRKHLFLRNHILPEIGQWTLQWRHNGRDGVSNHQPRDCILNRLFRRRCYPKSSGWHNETWVTRGDTSSGWVMANSLCPMQYVIQMKYHTTICHLDDLAKVAISSGWVTAMLLCHPEDKHSHS